MGPFHRMKEEAEEMVSAKLHRNTVIWSFLCVLILIVFLLGFGIGFGTAKSQNKETLQEPDLLAPIAEALNDESNCPPPWEETESGCYLLGLYACGFTVGCTWEQASTFCETNGGQLAEMENMAELLSVQNLFISSSEWWLGASDKRERGTYRWMSGAILPRSSDMWGRGEPNDNGGPEHCVHMFSLHGYKLNDVTCSYTIHNDIPFNPLCEK